MKKGSYVIRKCTHEDLPGVAKLAARLVREHHQMDPQRFMIWDRIEDGYAAYLSGEIKRKRSLVFVAVAGEKIIGYTYGRIEPRDWNALRNSCGAIQDVYVDERYRRRGIAASLLRELIQALADLGAPQVILMTAARNESAHSLFEDLGFRTTMMEMTLETPQNAFRNKREN